MKKTISFIKVFIAIITTVHSESLDKKDEWWKSSCQHLKYESPVDDKPDLLVAQYSPLTIFDNGIYVSYAYSNCRIRSNESQSSLLYLSEYLPNSLVYDSRSETFYRETQVGDAFQEIHQNGEIKSTDYKREVSIEDYQIFDLALDWVTRNLYLYTQKFVGIVNLNRKKKVFKKLFRHDGTYEGKIILAPNDGYMFLMYKPNVIERRNLDGSHQIAIRVHKEPELKISSMILDPYSKKLFYSVHYPTEGKLKSSIHYMELNGGPLMRFSIPENLQQRQITVDENYIYYPMRGDYSTIVRIHKNNGTRDLNFSITNYNHTEKSYAINLINLGLPQDIREDHPCLTDNGGCKQRLCIAIPGGNGKLTNICK